MSLFLSYLIDFSIVYKTIKTIKELELQVEQLKTQSSLRSGQPNTINDLQSKLTQVLATEFGKWFNAIAGQGGQWLVLDQGRCNEGDRNHVNGHLGWLRFIRRQNSLISPYLILKFQNLPVIQIAVRINLNSGVSIVRRQPWADEGNENTWNGKSMMIKVNFGENNDIQAKFEMPKVNQWTNWKSLNNFQMELPQNSRPQMKFLVEIV